MAERETKKARKYVEERGASLGQSAYGQIVIVSDSKAWYLKPELDNLESGNIPELHWLYVGGRRTREGVHFLKRHIALYAHQNITKKTLILFWHLTCDVTIKDKNLIKQRYSSADELLANTIEDLNELVKLKHEFKVDIGILEIPPIFTHYTCTTDKGGTQTGKQSETLNCTTRYLL